MKNMTSAEVREAFLSFFEEHKHQRVDSSSLVPANDPTLLFANSGMVQFKDVFLGNDKRDYTRATSSQRCMRVSGKHNDLEEVGPSPRHHTFFEMLGNFSFGDYFKLEAMEFAWQLLTQVYELPADRLAVTIYEKDDESYELWTEKIGIPSNRIARLGPDDNFWQMAETGPCGPNSEIHWDKYPERGEDTIVQSLLDDDGRFMEIWNLVFMQFNRTQPDPEHTGQFDEPLPATGVDTGMGLERVVSVLQGKENNYDTDLFMPIIVATQRLTGHDDATRDQNIVPYRVIADHIRAAVFLVADGVLPGAKGRDSVTRLVIRRAARFGKKIGLNEPFMAKIADIVIDEMGGHYTEIVDRAEIIKKAITKEEELFLRTLDRGMSELNEMLDDLDDGEALSGDQAFYLKATLGLPIEVTRDVAEEHGRTVDMAGFRKAEEEHSIVSGGGQAMGEIVSTDTYATILNELVTDNLLSQEGVDYFPYGNTILEDARVVALISDGRIIESPIAGDKIEVVLDKTSFYVESGGQVSDTGILSGDGWQIEVEDMRQPVKGLIVHVGEVIEGRPKVGDKASVQVDHSRRDDIIRNHTGTHLLHAALRNNLGTHVHQRGSLVAPERLRFDFAHDERMTIEQIRAVESEVNDAILANYTVKWDYKPLQQAREEGAMALFGEKYSDTVRTVSIGANGNRYSYELCGGVHVDETAEIGAFIITSEGSVSSGVRRVEALTGRAALEYVQKRIDALDHVAHMLGTTSDQVVQRVNALQDELSATKKTLSILRRDLAKAQFDSKMQDIEKVHDFDVLILSFDDVPMDTMREMTDWFRNRVDRGVIVIGSLVDGKPQIMASVTDDLTKKGIHAGNIVKAAANEVGGGGGGRPNLAQAGGKDGSMLPQALKVARQLIADTYTD